MIPDQEELSLRYLRAAEGIADDLDITAPLPLRSQAYDRIEYMIMKGILQPGERLVEADLAQTLKVSRGPVREALLLLERDGWVENRPRLGSVVRRRTAREVEELFEVRTVLEIRAMQMAAQKLSDKDRQELARLMGDAERAYEADDIAALVDANSAVHHFLPTLSGNASMAGLVRTISRRIRWYTMTPLTPVRAPEVLLEHRAIVQALLEGDAAKAAEAMSHHTRMVWQSYANR